MLDAARARPPIAPDRIVVAVDPPVTSGRGADECGIVVAGVAMKGPPQDWRAEVIADAQRRRALAAGVGRAGGGGLPRARAPTGWWPR